MRKPPEKTPYTIVAVKWTDAHADAASSWTTLDDIDPSPYVITSFGITLPNYVKPNHVSVAQSCGGGHLDGIIHIPQKMVIDITVLGTVDEDDL